MHNFICRWPLFLLLGLAPSLPACADRYPPTYSAEAITATVVDAETKKPLPGVVVTANWQLLGGMEGNYPVGQMNVLETVTDQHGRFTFPAWGPKKRPKGYLREDDPQLLLFKPGYEYRRLNNYQPRANAVVGRYPNDPVAIEIERQNRGYSPNRRSEWNGKVIEMKRFGGAGEGYARHLGSLSLSWAYTGSECEWKKIPRMVLASHNQAMRYKKQKITTSLYTINNLIPQEGYPDTCGAREFFKEYRP